MRLAAILLLSTLALAAPVLAAPSNLGNKLERKADARTGAPLAPQSDEGVAVGGETIYNATMITSLPFFDTGNTCSFQNDWNPSCAGTGARDVVYRYTPPADGCITVSLCGSSFDAVLHMYDGALANPVACNDDYCGNPPLQSKLQSVPVLAGHTYYIFVDGYERYFDPIFGGYDACGNYTISVTADCPPPCSVVCPPDAIQEGETICYDGYVDNYNAGCNSSPQSYVPLTCGPEAVTVCGTYGSYNFNGQLYRDTDWYQVTVSTRSLLRLSATGEAPTRIAIVNQNCGTLADAHSEPCQEASCQVIVEPGTYAFFVAGLLSPPNQIPCGSRYVMRASCTPQDPEYDPMGILHCNLATGVPTNNGREVLVRGIVTSDFPTSSATRLTIQDATGGVTVFGTPQVCAQLGDDLEVRGTITHFNGLLEVGYPLTIVTKSSGNPQPAPLVLTPAQVNATFDPDYCEPNESRLVRLHDVFLRTSAGAMPPAGATFAANTSYRIIHAAADSATNFTTLRIVQTANPCMTNPLVGTVIPVGDCPLQITGVLSQFDVSSPYTDAYQVQPRVPADVMFDCPIATRRTTWGSVKALYR